MESDPAAHASWIDMDQSVITDKSILFFDNEAPNWVGNMDIHENYIYFLKVNDETPNRLIHSMSEKGLKGKYTTELNMRYMNLFLDLDNTYAKYLDRSIKSESSMKPKDQKLIKKFKEDIPSNGIENIRPLITENTKYILLDWDRTVTAIEGMYFDGGLLEKSKNGEIQIEDILFYIMGGPERTGRIIEMFRDVIRMLNNNRHVNEYGIEKPIFIITNNPNASSTNPNRLLYIELIKIIFLVSDELANRMLYSAKDYGFKKKNAICASPLVSFLVESCATVSMSMSLPSKIITDKKTKSPREEEEKEEKEEKVSTKKPKPPKGGGRNETNRRERKRKKRRHTKKKRTRTIRRRV